MATTTKRGGELCIRRRIESEGVAADDEQPHDDDGRRNHIDLENRMRAVGIMDDMMKY